MSDVTIKGDKTTRQVTTQKLIKIKKQVGVQTSWQKGKPKYGSICSKEDGFYA